MSDQNYIEALVEAKNYHEDPERLSNYKGVAKGDQLSVKQNNIEIILLTKLYKKLDNLALQISKLEELIKGLKEEARQLVDKLINQFQNLKVNTDQGSFQPKQNKSYRYY